jgi:hypothetical protein
MNPLSPCYAITHSKQCLRNPKADQFGSEMQKMPLEFAAFCGLRYHLVCPSLFDRTRRHSWTYLDNFDSLHDEKGRRHESQDWRDVIH